MPGVIIVVIVACVAVFIISRTRGQQRPVGAFRSSADGMPVGELGDSADGDDHHGHDHGHDAGDAGDSGGGDSGDGGGGGRGE